MKITKVSDTEVEISTPVTEKFTVEKFSLDDLVSQKATNEGVINFYQADLDFKSAEIEKLKAANIELDSKITILRDAGCCTTAEIEAQKITESLVTPEEKSDSIIN